MNCIVFWASLVVLMFGQTGIYIYIYIYIYGERKRERERGRREKVWVG
jgi:hypothetical protein